MVDAEFGRVDVLVNSAGGQFHAAAAEITPRGWAAVIETNLTGTFLACRSLFALLRPSDRAAIVTVVANVWQSAAPPIAHSASATPSTGSSRRTDTLAPSSRRTSAEAPAWQR